MKSASVRFRHMRRACNTKWQLNSFFATENTKNLGALWSDEEVRALIHIWGDDKIQQELDGASRKKSIFVAIAKKKNERETVQPRLATV